MSEQPKTKVGDFPFGTSVVVAISKIATGKLAVPIEVLDVKKGKMHVGERFVCKLENCTLALAADHYAKWAHLEIKNLVNNSVVSGISTLEGIMGVLFMDESDPRYDIIRKEKEVVDQLLSKVKLATKIKWDEIESLSQVKERQENNPKSKGLGGQV